MYRIFVSLFVAIVFTGCASNSTKSSTNSIQSKSEARQIAEAGGLNIKDMPRDRLAESLPKDISGVTVPMDVAMAGGMATGIFTPGSGLTSAQGTGLMLMSALIPRSASDPTARNRLFAWMPLEMAEDEKQSGQIMMKSFEDAIRLALPNHRVDHQETGSTRGFTVKITGQQCETGCLFGVAYIDTPSVGKAPSKMGGYDAYVWKVESGFGKESNSWGSSHRTFPLVAEDMQPIDRIRFYSEVSKHLPAWAHLYIAPNRKMSKIPVIFNEGNPFLFVSPTIEPSLAKK